MGHNHVHARSRLQGKFKVAVGLTAAILIAEVVGGILTNSLALLSDAAHVFGDVFALCLSWVAIYLSTFPPTSKRTYGYHRAEVFAAFINGTSLMYTGSTLESPIPLSRNFSSYSSLISPLSAICAIP